MRKSEMTERQLNERKLVIEKLARAGWKGSDKNKLFDQNLSFQEEAVMEYRNPNMGITVSYSASDESIYINLEELTGANVNLTIPFGDKLDELLKTITDFQDKIDSKNYRENIRTILRKKIPVYVEDDENGPKKLIDDGKGDS